MWLAGGLWKLFGITTRELDPFRLSLATLPVAIVGSLFPVASYRLTLRAWGREQHLAALLIALLFATEPLFIAHSCNAHLDMLVTTFAWSSLLCAIVTLKERKRSWALASGVLLGLALLTKLSAAGYALGITLIFVVTSSMNRARWRTDAKLLTLLAGASALTAFALWPALWVAPVSTLARLHDGLLTEVDKVSSFMFLGHTGKLSLPQSIYGLYALFLVTPEFVLPLLFGAVSILVGPAPARRHAVLVTLGTLPLALLILQGSRVGARYLLPMLPWIGTVSALALAAGLDWVKAHLPRRSGTVVVGSLVTVLLAGRLLRDYRLNPLPITYCSTWTQIDCADVFHIGWGEGLREAAEYIEQHQRARFGDRPIVIYGSSYASTMGAFTRVKSTRDPTEAELLIVYLPDYQRKLKQYRSIAELVEEQQLAPLRDIEIAGHRYVRLYPGPKY
jgi:4-amino-4-deoxy-L-arabinose transferase-like glycosyltransferase